ncbi:MAG: amidase family protein, partial [Myxococcota bacterium]
AEDTDCDGVPDPEDLCPRTYHLSQRDIDEDGLADACDRCPSGEDTVDRDGDGVSDCFDVCPATPDASQRDADGDGIGDACDNCREVPNASQWDTHGDGVGDACALEPVALEHAAIADLHTMIRSGARTCEDIVTAHLERIQRYDLDVRERPAINAMVAINARALEHARALDASFASSGELVGPLHCAPIVIKDVFDSEELPTSSGTLALVASKAPDDGFALARLRQRGAILLGTASMDELSKGIFGISSRSGRTGNAYDTGRSPGGSSSGSASAVAAGFAIGGVGTDNCASLSLPAAYQGLVTIRSSRGVVSLDGVFPSNPADTIAGPMARSMEDLIVLFDAMAGEDPSDPMTSGIERPDSYLDALDPTALEGKRVGIVRQIGERSEEDGEGEEGRSGAFRGASVEVLAIYSRAARELERLGAEVVDGVRLPELSTRRANVHSVPAIDAYLSEVDGPIDSFRELCSSDRVSEFAARSGFECRWISRWSKTLGRRAWPYGQRSTERYARNAEYIARTMDEFGLDALLLPVSATGSAHSSSRTNCILTSVSGAPSVNLVVGASSHATPMPIGMKLVGRRYDERSLLAMAYAYELGTGHRFPARLPVSDAPMPALDIEAFNDAHLEIGERIFEEYLRDGDKFDASLGDVAEVIEEVVRTLEWGWLFE